MHEIKFFPLYLEKTRFLKIILNGFWFQQYMLPIHIKGLSAFNYILPISLIVSFAVLLKDKGFTLGRREVVRNKKYGKTTRG